jgi:xanthine dehydrogenase accessory factor
VAPRRAEHRHPDHSAEGLEDPPRSGGHGLNGQEPAARSLFGRAAELAAAGHPFAFATVVAVARPTSARPGAHGIVHPDGSIEGWVGGSCAQPVVVREALHAMADGQPRLLRLSKDALAEGRRGDGIIELVMTCHSGGTLEIYVEPNLPAPVLWVAGTTPIAGALVALGAASGFAVTLFDPIAEADSFPGAGLVLSDTDLASIDPDATPFVVVATQGQWDEEALAGALRREARYVGLVASPTRAAAVRAWLRDEAGLADDRLAALRAPAGIDLGAETAEEVALSILAELVQVRRGRADFVASPGPATTAPGGTSTQDQAPLTAAPDDIVLLDPVCGMTVDRDHARHLAEHDGVVYAFCSLGCRTRFVKEPTAYVSASVSSGG